MAVINFNANQVAPDEGRAGAIPADWYRFIIESTEVKPNNAGTGTILVAVAKVIEGQYTNRKVYINFNIRNASEKAQEIGQKQLSALCHATGQLVLQDTAQLHNVPFRAKVKVRPADGQYEESNDITAYRNDSDITAVSKNTGVNLNAPAAGRPMAPPPAAAPQQFAPPVQQAPMQPPMQPPQQFQQPVQQAAPTAQQAQWNPPAAPQPWQAPAQEAPAQQAAPQYQPAPVQQAAPQYQAPVQDPNVQQAQQGQPAWAGVPSQAAPAQQMTTAPSQASTAAPAPMTPNPQAGAVLPPWMQQPAQ